MIHHHHYQGASGGSVPAGATPMSYGEVYFSGFPNTTNTTLVAATPAKVLGTTTLGLSSEFDMPANNRLRYTGTGTKRFRVEVDLTGWNPGTANADYFVYIYLNGVQQQKSTQERRINNNISTAAMNSVATLDLSTNDYVELWVSCGTTQPFLARYAVLSATEVQ